MISLIYVYDPKVSGYPHTLQLTTDDDENQGRGNPEWYANCDHMLDLFSREFNGDQYSPYDLYGGKSGFATKALALQAKMFWTPAEPY